MIEKNTCFHFCIYDPWWCGGRWGCSQNLFALWLTLLWVTYTYCWLSPLSPFYSWAGTGFYSFLIILVRATSLLMSSLWLSISQIWLWQWFSHYYLCSCIFLKYFLITEIVKVSFYIIIWFLSFSLGKSAVSWFQGLMHARHLLYHSSALQALALSLSPLDYQ